jgi:4-hydroxy-tetrahydrodipicolinate synthase
LGDRLTILSGDDALTVAFGSVGASGVISVTSNVKPREVSAVTTALLANDYVRARAYHFALLELHNAMFVEPNPGPAKAALASMGRMTDVVRLPLVPTSAATKQRVADALARLDQEFPRITASA